jgi:putative transposase
MNLRHFRPVQKRRGRPGELSGKPHEVWCADITYLPSMEDGWLYLAGQLDLNTKRLVDWKLGDSLNSHLGVEAFERAVKLWQIAPQIHHSDRAFNTPPVPSVTC